MISATLDPQDPSRILLTSTVSLYFDRVAVAALSDEIEKAIREQAVRDLLHNTEVRKLVAQAATETLLKLLGQPQFASDTVIKALPANNSTR